MSVIKSNSVFRWAIGLFMPVVLSAVGTVFAWVMKIETSLVATNANQTIMTLKIDTLAQQFQNFVAEERRRRGKKEGLANDDAREQTKNLHPVGVGADSAYLLQGVRGEFR